ncbi:hypothetical protein H8E88_18550 [candidate division KSB1 bacterium]|nr:hypothetical protein [candidate division KSB1 bacterium]
MDIFAEIKGIKYNIHLASDLQEISFDDFDINFSPAFCLIKNKKLNFAISKWVSPKRTRSYPFERVYNTLPISKKITVIPIIKDEGAKGDRDFIQWDTVSLMSLLDVHVIFAYYIKAEKHKTRENKITKQQFDNNYIISKISEISNYHSSALHWNLKETKETLPNLIKKEKKFYTEIEKQLGVKFHNISGIEKFKKQFEKGVNEFMQISRQKAHQAQHREQLTTQPKEILTTATKATITIKNYLGGLYYFTTDELAIQKDTLQLIESKHSKNSKLPSLGDIKDGLLKMILYCNLTNVTIDNKKYVAKPVLKLTSEHLKGCIKSNDKIDDISIFFERNNFNTKQKKLVEKLFLESHENDFTILIEEA